MTNKLDPAILAVITQEARQCFLEEDAPGYLHTLEQSLENDRDSADWTEMMRAAHSLKGGAGIAELPSLKELAHKLEDLLQALQQGEQLPLEPTWELITRSVNEIAFLLSQAAANQDVVADTDLIQALEAMVSSEPEIAEEALKPVEEAVKSVADSGTNSMIIIALQEDLEANFAEIEELPGDAPPILVQQCLEKLCDESLFLGETLDLPWLVEEMTVLQTSLSEFPPEMLLEIGKQAIADLRSQRDNYLESFLSTLPKSVKSTGEDRQQANTETSSYESLQDTTVSITEPEPELEIQPDHDLESFPTVTVPTPELEISTPQQLRETKVPVKEPEEQVVLSQIRMPLKRLETMSNTIGELILIQDRLSLQQKQFKSANRRLRQFARQFEPIREQVSILYDQLAIAPVHSGTPALVGGDRNGSDSDFDSLEMDRYSELHRSLQTFQELMLQVQETRHDLELINRELAEDLDQVGQNLNSLYNNVTDSRLVPFRLLSQRFIPQIQTLNRRYDKLVQLKLEGEEALVDQALLEQLQTPLTHLVNNAFDHGIEPTAERLANQKPEMAEIILKAKIEGNQLIVILKDDGRGVDLAKVYQRALEKGICPAHKSMEELSSAEILDWIFQADFSTAAKVSQLSGRGMGLDIVRQQVRRLRGTIEIDTQLGKGTIFTLKLPLNLSLLSLSLIQLPGRLVAIPIDSIRSTIPYAEIEWIGEDKKTAIWMKQEVPVASLSSLLPCARVSEEEVNPRIGIVLESAFGPLLVTADALLSESKLIVKPFDDTVFTPSYLAGCTILGTGEVVPVVLPQAFDLSSSQSQLPPKVSSIWESRKLPHILVVEDSVATRHLLQRLLSALNYQVTLARDGQEGLEILEQRQGQIDLVITDIEMPRMNGFELLENLRKDVTWQDLPVVMVTSRTGERHRQHAMDLSANGYLGKPIQPQELLDTIQSLIEF